MQSKSLTRWTQQLGTLPASSGSTSSTCATTSSASCHCRCAACRACRISICANLFTELPDWIVEWPNLQKLELRWLKPSSVPAAVGALEERGCRVLL